MVDFYSVCLMHLSPCIVPKDLGATEVILVVVVIIVKYCEKML